MWDQRYLVKDTISATKGTLLMLNAGDAARVTDLVKERKTNVNCLVKNHTPLQVAAQLVC